MVVIPAGEFTVGYRMQARPDKGHVRLLTARSWTRRRAFPIIAKAFENAKSALERKASERLYDARHAQSALSKVEP
jgi:hypothetical protein